MCSLEVISGAPKTMVEKWHQYRFFWLVTYTWRLRVFWVSYDNKKHVIYHSNCDTLENKKGLITIMRELISLDLPGKCRIYSHQIHAHIYSRDFILILTPLGALIISKVAPRGLDLALDESVLSVLAQRMWKYLFQSHIILFFPSILHYLLSSFSFGFWYTGISNWSAFPR